MSATRDIVVIEDRAGLRYRLFPDHRAAQFEPSEWTDLDSILHCAGSRRIFDEIAPDEDGEVELLHLVECEECQGCGGFIFEPTGRLTFPARKWSESTLGQRCEECGGHGRRFDAYRPPWYAPLASLSATVRAA